MKKFFRNSLFMLAAGVLMVSCADYNVTDDFRAEADPSFVEPYKDLGPVKSYINRELFPNMSLCLRWQISTSRNWLMLRQSPTSTMSLSELP